MCRARNAVVNALALALLAVALPGLFGGCADRTTAEPYYSITFVNGTDQAVTDVKIAFGDYTLDRGTIASGVTKSEVGCMEPVARSIAARWTAPGGTAHQWQQTIRPALPDGFEGEIRLTLNADGAVALTITHEHHN